MNARRYPAEGSDSVMFLLNRNRVFNNLIQMEMEFDYALDFERLRNAFRLILVKYPIAGCRFVENWKRSYFESLPAIPEIIKKGSLAELEAFINEPVNPENEAQLRAFFAVTGKGCRLAIKVSHALCDVGGLKELAAAVSDIYNTLKTVPGFIPEECSGSRRFHQLFKHLSVKDYLKIMLNSIIELATLNIPFISWTLPLKEVPIRPFGFEKRCIPADRASRISSFAKGLDATLNDVFVAAFLKALMRFQTKIPGAAIRTGFTVDHRIWTIKGPADNIANLSAFEFIKVDGARIGCLTDTVREVGRIIRKRKPDHFGLNQTYGVLLFSAIPYALTKYIWSKLIPYGIRTGNMPNLISNYSFIPEDKIVFDRPPVRAWIHPPIIMTPNFHPALCSYRGEFTISAGIPESEPEKSKIRLFLDLMLDELPA